MKILPGTLRTPSDMSGHLRRLPGKFQHITGLRVPDGWVPLLKYEEGRARPVARGGQDDRRGRRRAATSVPRVWYAAPAARKSLVPVADATASAPVSCRCPVSTTSTDDWRLDFTFDRSTSLSQSSGWCVKAIFGLHLEDARALGMQRAGRYQLIDRATGFELRVQ